jgi:carboxyl-terminal processing protease
MKARTLLAGSVATWLVVAAAARAEAPKGSPEKLAHRVWAVADLVLDKHIDPPARQQMLLDGVKALYRASGRTPPPELGARVSALTDEAGLAPLLAEAWPAASAKLPHRGVDPDTPEDVVLRGMLGHGEGVFGGDGYLSAREKKAHEVIAGNRYVGTGVQIRYDQKVGLAQIVNPFPGGPCRKAGGRPNDLILSIDGVDMHGKPLRDFVKRLQGEAGTSVTAVVRQPKEKETRTLNMVRGVIPFASALGWKRKGEESWTFRLGTDSPVGYLRLSDVKVSTAHELRRLETAVRGEGVQALVLDLRFTSGDDLGHAALVADALLDGGLMWKVRDRSGRVKEVKADRDCLFRDLPLVVLVGRHTGPAGEAVAAALQDNRRAVVVGEMTQGRDGVTSVLPAPDGEGAVVIRTAVRERARPAKGADGEDAGSAVRPDQYVAAERKLDEPLMRWFQQQESPEPDPSVQPPDDPQLTRAVAAAREKLAKKDGGSHGA